MMTEASERSFPASMSPALGSSDWALAPDVLASRSHQSDPARRARLRWRARRGLLENDLILQRFLDRHECDLTDGDVAGLTQLLDLTDSDLMDLLLGRREPDGSLAVPDVLRIVARLRAA